MYVKSSNNLLLFTLIFQLVVKNRPRKDVEVILFIRVVLIIT